ncbi:hypothetical protein Spb1_03820 [Planctopirus ephydatiae]|uniref:Uncharacterized protein n=1 Tax=Planctopirus ephydatiae TaxID=2528019 RepID=A0A518GIV5_9PLAN|nr:hypothetical protein [Planctopirus ephydatiae]QDV28519.1 hypothetical protein Spb1_03820 [Planctopirus ephydatiae]
MIFRCWLVISALLLVAGIADAQPKDFLNKSDGWFADNSHFTGVCEIFPESEDFEFWKWLISQNEWRRGRKSSADIESLKWQYTKVTHHQ